MSEEQKKGQATSGVKSKTTGGDNKKKRKPRRSKEEIELDGLAKIERKEKRAETAKEKKRIKEEKRLERLNPPSEEELVHKYVKRVTNNQKYHGRIDKEKFGDMASDKKANKNLWLDTDFYFSVVFQSSEQKYEFLAQLGVTEEQLESALDSKGIKIVNGLELAKKLDIKLDTEEMGEYPVPSLDLFPYVLDTETTKVPEQ